MLINPGAQQRVAALKHEKKKNCKEELKEFFCFLFLYSDSFAQFSVRISAAPERRVSGVGVGEDGTRFVSLSQFVPFPEGKLAGGAWPPSGGHAYGNQLKNRTQDGFHSRQQPRKKDFFSFLLPPGRNGLFCTWLKRTKHKFLVVRRAMLPESKEYAVCEI